MVSPDLLKYIRSQKVGGKADEVILQELRTAGWPEDAITEAFDSLKEQPVVAPVLTPETVTPSNKVLALLTTIKSNPIFSKIKPKYVVFGVLGLLVVTIGVPLLITLLKNLANPTAGKVDKDATVLTVDQLDKYFKKAINSKELEFTGTSASEFTGCSLKETYKGALYGENKYFRYKTEYKDAAALEGCTLAGMGQNFSEAYWIEEDVYYRESENDSLTKLLDVVDKNNIAQKPTTFLTNFFGENENVEILSATDSSGKINAKVKMKTKGSEQELELVLAKSSGDIESINYTQYPNGFPKGEAKVTGNVKFLKFTTPIALPPFAPTQADFLKDAFIDISSYNPISYSVDTSGFGIFNGKEVVDGEFSLKVEHSDGNVAVCFLSDEVCMQKLAELRETFNLLTPLINAASPANCEKKPEVLDATRAAKYAGILSISLNNETRTSPEIRDYSFAMTLNTEGDSRNQYNIRAKVGKEYCFSGVADEMVTQDLLNRFDLFQQGVN